MPDTCDCLAEASSPSSPTPARGLPSIHVSRTAAASGAVPLNQRLSAKESTAYVVHASSKASQNPPNLNMTSSLRSLQCRQGHAQRTGAGVLRAGVESCHAADCTGARHRCWQEQGQGKVNWPRMPYVKKRVLQTTKPKPTSLATSCCYGGLIEGHCWGLIGTDTYKQKFTQCSQRWDCRMAWSTLRRAGSQRLADR